MPEAFIHISLVYLFTLVASTLSQFCLTILTMRSITRGFRLGRMTQEHYYENRNMAMFSIFFFSRYTILLAASIATGDLVLYYGMRPEKSPLVLAFIWTFSICGLFLSAHFIDAFWLEIFRNPVKEQVE